MPKRFRDYFNNEAASLTFALCRAVVLFLAISNITVVRAIINKIVGVVSPFIYAFRLAYILNRPLMWIEGHAFKNLKKKRTLSIVATYRLFFAFVGFVITSVIPQLGRSISYIVEGIPPFLANVGERLNEIISEYHWTDRLVEDVNETWTGLITTATQKSLAALPGLLNMVFSFGSGVINTLMVLIISVYMLADKERLLFQIKKATYAYLSKEKADRRVYIANKANRIFSGFLIGKLIDSTIIGVLCFAGMIFICPEYSTLIAVIIGVTNMVPFFGPFIGAIPSIFILLMVSPKTAVIFTFFVLFLQQLDGNVIGPRILGNSLGLSPLWVLAGILVGNGLFGITGMLIGVPTFATLYGLVSENIADRLDDKKIYADYDENAVVFRRTEHEDAE